MNKHLSQSIKLPAVLLLFMSALASAEPAATAAAAPDVTSIAILNFDNLSQDKAAAASHAWLRKGLADLLINDLATLPTLRVMTREQMQMLLQEARLQQGRLDKIPQEEAEKMRRYFAVDLVLRGSYTIENDTLTLQATLLRQSDNSPVVRFQETAPLGDALRAQKALARQLLGHVATASPEAVAAWLLPQWTASISAAQLLYEGVDLFDQGDYLRAWHNFRQAQRRDPDYADAAYWIARMHYYRTDYAHARPDYDAFINRFPNHGRIGDAVMELIHSAERLSDSPAEMLALYQRYQEGNWQDVKVYNQADYLSHSPLSDWLAKRQQGALAYLQRYDEAFQVLSQSIADNRSTNKSDKDWQKQAQDVLANLAMNSEDSGGSRLISESAPYHDIPLTLEKPFIYEDLTPFKLKGMVYNVGNNYRLLAPAGYRFKNLKAEIMRTNDPTRKSVCRLQIRRYRYVDINTCWTEDAGNDPAKRYIFDVAMPPNATWFLLRPEYHHSAGAGWDPHNPFKASFDGWRVDAEFEPLHPQAGGVDLCVSNVMEFRALINDNYARERNGVIGNLPPGTHKLTITDMFKRKNWGFETYEASIEVKPNTHTPLAINIDLNQTSKDLGWQTPIGLAIGYPTYKHSPRRLENWLDGAPSYTINPQTGERAVVWSHLDDLWLATSTNGAEWTPPVNLPAPINSAHVELNPRLIRTTSGGYALLFLSDRSQQRSLGLYAATSDDLHNWTRPTLVSEEHHSDLAFMQARDGSFIVLTATGDTYPSHLKWRTSHDMVNWSEAGTIPLVAAAMFIGLTQDATGLFHLLWYGMHNFKKEGLSISGIPVPFHMTSHDLHNWQTPKVMPHGTHGVISLSTIVADHHLWATFGTVDQHYSGSSRLTLMSLDLQEPNAEWHERKLPNGVLSGLTALGHDSASNTLILAWSMTDMRLDAGRFAGPVFLMSGNPTSAKPIGQRRNSSIAYEIASQHPGQPLPAITDAHTALALRPQPETTNLTPKKSLRNDLANGAFASGKNETKPPPQLNSFQWELLQKTPSPGARLRHLTAHHLNPTMRHVVSPLTTTPDNFNKVRERRPFSISYSFKRDQKPYYMALGPQTDTSRIAARMNFSITSRDPGDNYFIIALSDEATENHYAASAAEPPAPLGRQLAFFGFTSGNDTPHELGIAANNTTLVNWNDKNFNKAEHILHLIQYDNVGEIYLNHQRLAIVPLHNPPSRPILAIKSFGSGISFYELDIWELKE